MRVHVGAGLVAILGVLLTLGAMQPSQIEKLNDPERFAERYVSVQTDVRAVERLSPRRVGRQESEKEQQDRNGSTKHQRDSLRGSAMQHGEPPHDQVP